MNKKIIFIFDAHSIPYLSAKVKDFFMALDVRTMTLGAGGLTKEVWPRSIVVGVPIKMPPPLESGYNRLVVLILEH